MKEKINRLIAEHIMGLEPQKDFGEWSKHTWKLDKYGRIDDFAYDGDTHNGPECETCGYSYCQHCQDGPSEPCRKSAPSYSEYLWSAMKVVEKLREEGFYSTHTDLSLDSGQEWWSWHFIKGSESFDAQAETMALAICKSAIKAKGVKIDV